MAGLYLIHIGVWFVYIMALSWFTVTAQMDLKPAPALRAQGWVNLPETEEKPALEKLKGNVVVLCFFNADDEQLPITLKQVQRIQKAYRYRPVKVLGIHSPPDGWQTRDVRKIRREDLTERRKKHLRGPVSDRDKRNTWRRRNIDPIEAICDQYKLSFPIMIDHDRYMRDRYRLKSLPAFQLITPDGYVGPKIFGNKAYQKLSREVDRLIRVHRKDRKAP